MARVVEVCGVKMKVEGIAECGHTETTTATYPGDDPILLERALARCDENLRSWKCQYCTMRAGWGFVGADKFWPDKAEAQWAPRKLDERVAALGYHLERIRPKDDDPYYLVVTNAAGETLAYCNCHLALDGWLREQENE